MNTKKRTFDNVHIIESNRRTGASAEGQALSRILPMSGIRTHLYVVASEPELRDAVSRIANDKSCKSSRRKTLPFLHFALHASSGGISIGPKTSISWPCLLEILTPLRTQLKGNLLIAMSACEGFFAYQLACSYERYLYHFLVGTRDTLDWPDAVLAFHIFYYSFFVRKASLPEAVAAMNVPLLSRRYAFDYTWGSEVQRIYSRTHDVHHAVVAIRGRGNKTL